MAIPEFSGVTVSAKANVYFDGRVVSHGITLSDGSKKTLGLIYPGRFHFGTAAPERMEIIAGSCEVVMDGTKETLDVQAGSGQVFECQRFLTSYWPSFLRRHVPLPGATPGVSAAAHSAPAPGAPGHITARPAAPKAAGAAPSPPPAATPKEDSPSMVDRLKSWLPKSWR